MVKRLRGNQAVKAYDSQQPRTKTMQSNRHDITRKSLNNLAPTGAASAGLYDLWLNSRLSTVSPSMVTGVISSSSHQLEIDSERLAEKLIQLSRQEMVAAAGRL